MKKIVFFILLSAAFVFSEDIENTENTENVRVILPQRRPIIQPIIEIDGRKLSVTVPTAPDIKVKVFTTKGRKITKTRRKVEGEKAVIALPRSAKRNDVIIITIDANREYYSQRVNLN